MKANYHKKLSSWYRKFQIGKSPQMNLVWGFLLYTLVGFVLLSIPLFHKIDISLMDNLFISTSAISTTGLATIDLFESYNFMGQLVILSLVQLGGIGYMTLTTYFLLFTTKKITHWHNKVLGTEFALPKNIIINDFIKSVIVFTAVMEALGAILFYIAFTNTGMEGFKAVWFSIFHSISAFCTAGFSLFPDGFESYHDNVFINLIICILSVAGSIGFIVITDIWYRITGRTKETTFTTKIIVYGFLILLFLGTMLIYTSESTSLLGTNHTILTSFFQAMSAMTTVGFNTIHIGNFSLPILLFVIFLMYIGASPSGTAGGMKITTLTAMIAIVKSRLLAQKKITFLNRIIPFERIYVATSTFILYTSLIFLFSFLLAYTDDFTFIQILFEVASALGTVGLSTGITADLSVLGKAMIIILMFIGRVGVLTFGFALLRQKQKESLKIRHDDLAV
ncbi:potassium transporter TrkG [Tamlana sp. 2_MG-2023]|uniref:TrkH family potassium uptake protein n=1 Tax=unclassified Tamlana TaxID=2614803 RepID=UPI0026E12669|nr:MULTISPECIES: potassium transporter TrkG [unclassified Tamlana]MDO6759169.1 potassium transporter TrkG [Tamlana sp. 2_MG-2023]MDO6790692.1 potassium transporter TrkG [Tamlana sp. 1_MG-2023]